MGIHATGQSIRAPVGCWNGGIVMPRCGLIKYWQQFSGFVAQRLKFINKNKSTQDHTKKDHTTAKV